MVSISEFISEIGEIFAEDRAGRRRQMLGCMFVWKKEHAEMVRCGQGL